MAAKLGFYENIFPLIAPKDNTSATIAATPFIDLATVLRGSVLVQFGVVTSATAADTLMIYLEASTAATTTSGTNIPFKYRYSGAPTANTWSAVADATSAGLSAGASDAFDNLSFLIDIDPDYIAEVETRRYVRVVMTEADAYSALNLSACAFLEQRYHQTTVTSATA